MKVTKRVVMELDETEVPIFVEVCELARRWIDSHKPTFNPASGPILTIGEHDVQMSQRIREFITKVFDLC